MWGKFLTKLREIRIDWLIARLGKPKSYRAEDALVKIGPPAVESLIVALRSSREGIAYEAARVPGRIKDGRAVDPLIEKLLDPNRRTKEEAAQALGSIGDTRVQPLLKVAWDEHSRLDEINRKAIEALGQIGDPGVLPTLGLSCIAWTCPGPIWPTPT